VDGIEEFLKSMQDEIDQLEQIGNKIEKEENYMGELKACLPDINQRIQAIFALMEVPQISLDLNPEFVLQVLNDLIYGIEQDDQVFLLDVLRYGLLEIYYFVGSEITG
jgi:hypothetical protein